MTRTRQRSTPIGQGRLSRDQPGGGWFDLSDANATEDRIVDAGGIWNENLDISHSKTVGGIWNGVHWHGDIRFAAENFVPLGLRGYSDYCMPNWLTVPGSPSDGAAATKILAETNPSRPVVSLPNFINELRELPALIKDAGGPLIRKLADANIRYNFGIAPLASDLYSMINFQSEVDKRQKELQALRDGGLRRKREIFSGVATDSVNRRSMQSVVLPFDYRGEFTVREKVWASVSWKPDSNFPKSNHELMMAARKAVFGFTLDPAVAWEAIPWSWLVDYFSNVGDFLIAKRNIIGATPGNVLVMRQRELEAKWTVVENPIPHWKAEECLKTTVTKSRRKSSPTLTTAGLQGLSAKQFSILGSLAILRGKNPYGNH